MTNPYYNKVFDVDPGSTNLSRPVEDEFLLVQAGFDAIDAALTINFDAFNAALALKANIDSPTFTGTPTAPTPPLGDNSTRLATTAALIAAIGASGSVPPTAGHEGEALFVVSGVAAWQAVSLSLTWASLTGKPTTIDGFGITNAQHAIEWLENGRRAATAPVRIDFEGARVRRRGRDAVVITPDIPHNLLINAGVH